MGARRVGLTELLAPVTSRRFLAAAWQQAPLHIARRRPRWLADLLTLEGMDALVENADASDPQSLALVRTRDGASESRPVPFAARRVAMAALARTFREGFTLVANALHRAPGPIAATARALAADLGHPVSANAYLTPPGAQGFLPHFDGHDVLVLQMHGRKQWEVFAPPIAQPLETQAATVAASSLAAPLLQIELRPGDALYLPRGYVHRAATARGPSLHLTFGIHVHRWADVLHHAIDELAASDAELRAIPTTDAAAALALLRRLGTPAIATAAIARHAAATAAAVPVHRFAAAAAIAALSAATRVERDRSRATRVDVTADRATLHIGDRFLDGPVDLAPAFRAIARARRFCARDLPGRITLASKLAIVRRLLDESLVHLA